MKKAVILLYLAILHALAIFLFGSGFLLTRISLDNVGKSSRDQPGPAFKKAVILVIDALRHDFTVPQDGSSHYWNHLTVLSEFAREQPRHAFLTKFIADPPTTTLQRLKGLTTGSLPTFVDAGSNFAGDAIDEDNLIGQLNRAGKRITFVGDDTWQALFPSAFVPSLNYPFESLNVWDLDTVDNGVYNHLFEAEDAFITKSQRHWDVAIAHALGLDHAGHRYGPSHPQTTRKLKEMDMWVRKLIKSIDDETVLIVLGDHGMNPQGDHGGDSIEELEAALFMYAKRPLFSGLQSNQTSTGVSQIDLVSTFALLFGLPIPFNNLGIPIPAAFSSFSPLTYDAAVRITVEQIQEYIEAYQERSSSMQQFLQIVPQPDYNNLSSLLQWQEQTLGIFRQQWAQYHMPSIIYGLSLMAGIILFQAMIYNQASHALSVAFGLSLAPLWIFHTLRESISFPVWGMASSVILIMLTMAIHRYSALPSRRSGRSSIGVASSLGLFALILHAAIFASNSFTIHEDRISLFLLATLLVPIVLRNFLCKKRLEWPTVGTFVVLITSRFVSSIRLCREEQVGSCQSNFYNISIFWILPAAIISTVLLHAALGQSFTACDNMTPSARSWLRVCALCSHASWLYWAIDHLDYANMKLFFARGLALVIAGASIYWWKWSLPMSFEVKHSRLQAKGTANVVPAAYVQLLMPMLVVPIILSRLLGSFSIIQLIVQMIMLCYFLAKNKVSTWNQCMVVFELAFLHFFSTGHQMALPFIQWDLAFFLSKSITYPVSPIAVAINAFASFLVVAVFLPLFGTWFRATDATVAGIDKDQSRQSTMTMGYVLAMTVVTFSTMLFATHFRRHLMVWKIFAPRFMCASLILLLTDVICILASLGYSASEWKLQRLSRRILPSSRRNSN